MAGVHGDKDFHLDHGQVGVGKAAPHQPHR